MFFVHTMDLIPRKINLKIKPHLFGGTLYLKGVFETEKGDHKNLEGFVTNEVALVVLSHLQREIAMKTIFEEKNIISVTGDTDFSEKEFIKTEDHFKLSGIPDYATFYKSKTHLSTYLHIKDKTLTGWVSLKWVEKILNAMLDNHFLIFKVKKDYCDRENFLNLVETFTVPEICKSSVPSKIAYLE